MNPELLPMEYPQPRRVLEPIELGYAAGFFDGEGSVGIGKKTAHGRPNFTCQLAVNNTDIDPLHWLCARWGGKVYKFRPVGVGHRRASWQWILPEKKITPFLQDVLPYLQIKGPVSLNALAFLRIKDAAHGRIRTETLLAELEHYWLEHRQIQLRRRPPFKPSVVTADKAGSGK